MFETKEMKERRSKRLDWLKGEPDGIQIRTGKLTGKEALKLGTGAVRLDGLPETRELFDDLMSILFDDLKIASPEMQTLDLLGDSQKLVRGLPPPLIRLREFESTPGLWVFDDAISGITFLMWSDGWKVHPWKGTSYEVVLKAGQRSQVRDAAIRFFRYLRKALETSASVEENGRS
jgi:hypothetical protein